MSYGFQGAQRQAVTSATEDWVRPTGIHRMPYEVRPVAEVDLATWARTHAAVVDRWLARYGAVLFSDFGVVQATFGPVAEALAGVGLSYRERTTPRVELAPGIYTSTEYPADQSIAMHNENAYQRCFPARLVFCCITAAREGGATPVADCRRVLARLDPSLVDQFRGRQVRYVRNFVVGAGLSWQEAFGTTERAEVESYCRTEGIDLEWRADGGLRTTQVRPAITRHEATGEEVWFNHVNLFHVAALDEAVRDALVAQFLPDGVPLHAEYGDGTPIQSATVAAIRAAYDAETVAVPWRAGDVLLVDNILAAHGRQPFDGPRRIVVSMAGRRCHDLPGDGLRNRVEAS